MARSRIPVVVAALLALGSLAGCQKDAPSSGSSAKHEALAPADAPKPPTTPLTGAQQPRADARRQVIYKAELSVEVRSPSDAQAKLSALAEREGGFVASAARADVEGRPSDVTLVLRVPAARFHPVLAEIRRLGDGKQAERIDSEDVTDEVVDLEARLRSSTRLEEQLLELLKTATTVDAALHVHKELANVRTEIERIQGRKQRLEREVALATIRVTLTAPPVQSVSLARIGASVSDAGSDALLVASGIVVAVIRLTGVLVPVALMLGLPLLVAALYLKRRANRARLPAPGI
jgi:hypothetical protein